MDVRPFCGLDFGAFEVLGKCHEVDHQRNRICGIEVDNRRGRECYSLACTGILGVIVGIDDAIDFVLARG